MHYYNTPPPPRTPGRLTYFRPTFVPRTKPLPTVWNRTTNPTPAGKGTNNRTRRSKSADTRRPKVPSTQRKVVHFANKPTSHTDNEAEEEGEGETLEEYLISRKPSAIYRYNSIQFLNSLRNFHQQQSSATVTRTTTLSRQYRMSQEILGNFVRLKTAQIEGLFGEPRRQQQAPFLNGHSGESTKQESENNDANVEREREITPPTTAKGRSPNSNSTSPPTTVNGRPATPSMVSLFRKKANVRPKSASIHSRRSRLQLSSGSPASTSSKSQSTPKLSKLGLRSSAHSEAHSDDDDAQVNGNDDGEEGEVESIEPFFHRSLDKISSIANWERQIRYELEIEKELQRRELDRQKEKLQSDQRKLEDVDKQLRIELDARERKLRLGEEELRSRAEEFTQRAAELSRREAMINEIVGERIKAEMKGEIEKLRKKFNELEFDKSNLSKKEERVKEVEARLHEQVRIVKEKIDSKRLSDIEMAKSKKELETVLKENEVLKERVDSMEDYQAAKFENRSMKGELALLREALESKSGELERERERWEREQRAGDQKVINLRGELRKMEQELLLEKQKAGGDLEEMTSKYDAVNGQLKRLQAFIKDHLAKLNSDFSSAAQSLNGHFKAPGPSYMGVKAPLSPMRHHSSSHHLHRMGRTGHGLVSSRGHHQRSVSMDGHDYSSTRSGAAKGWTPFYRSPARGCRLCNDEEECELEEHEMLDEEEAGLFASTGHLRSGVLIDYGDIEEEPHSGITERSPKTSPKHSPKHEAGQPANEAEPAPVREAPNEDSVVEKIVNKIYEKMSHKAAESGAHHLPGGDNLMSRLLFSISEQQSDNSLSRKLVNGTPTSPAKLTATVTQPTLAPSDNASPSVNQPLEAKKTPEPLSRKLSLRTLKSLLSTEKEDLDEEANEVQAEESSPAQYRSLSLYEEMLASEGGVAGTSASFSKLQLTGEAERRQAVLPMTPPSVENDDNNNHVLSQKTGPSSSEPQSTPMKSPLTAKAERPLSRSNSAGEGSRSDSKSESFEIDW